MYLWSCFPSDSVVKNLPANAGDTGLIPDKRRSPGEGNSNLLQYSCLENTVEPGLLQSVGSQKVGHDLVTEKQQHNHIPKSNFDQR